MLDVQVADLIIKLASDSFKDRQLAQNELQELGDSIIPHLVPYLVSDDPELRERVIELLDEVSKPMVNDYGLKLMPIRSGRFIQGDDGLENERPSHVVKITMPFWMGETEVTQEQFKRILGKNPSAFPAPDHPVENVTWNQADFFCKRLTTLMHRRGMPEYLEYRLPTEAQWEYCCRAGATTAFCFGNDEDQLSNWGWAFDRDSTNPVGKLKPNQWGLYDMHGNVWEWCSDWMGKYSGSLQINPVGSEIGDEKVIRGGSFEVVPGSCKSAFRVSYSPDRSYNDLGFRVVVVYDLERIAHFKKETSPKVPDEK